ncbi:MAG TPA: glycosyl hydrolase family 8 [Solirubrobacteraceae bacterium]|nr:glycosyl hydrolase family 8 [Solirubrobacteraceae bacterium]
MRLGRALVGVLAYSMCVTACGGTDHPPARDGAGSPASTSAAARFLSRYVTNDGRVIRHDQGGDIVSEGQAYGMLIAEVARRPALVRTIWSWTSAHLRRPDGLFAARASGDGHVQDPHSATDADVLIAYALLRYTGTDQATLNRVGRRIAESVLKYESVTLPGGASLPVAGPWAKSQPAPTVDPSYLMPGIFAALARFTGEQDWNRAAGEAINLIGELTDNGATLPPDWAQLSNGHLVPIGEPGGRAGVQYGLDAARLPIWFATACDPPARHLAANWWHNVLGSDNRSLPLALSLNGASINPDGSPLTILAGAGAAGAAGDRRAAGELRIEAEAFAVRFPTYYGNAWAALGPAFLDHAIDPCAEAANG